MIHQVGIRSTENSIEIEGQSNRAEIGLVVIVNWLIFMFTQASRDNYR